MPTNRAVGGIVKGEAIGVGASVAINKIGRNTRAIVGDLDAALNPLLVPTAPKVTLVGATSSGVGVWNLPGVAPPEKPRFFGEPLPGFSKAERLGKSARFLECAWEA